MESKLTDLELSYIAGFIDGEGSIGIVVVAKHKRFVTQIAACNCNYEVIKFLKDNFGGKVRERIWKNENWKPNFEWKLTARKAEAVIKAIYPYLMIKKKQAEIVLEAQALKNKYTNTFIRWNPDVKAARDAQLTILKEKCHLLNKRGTK